MKLGVIWKESNGYTYL